MQSTKLECDICGAQTTFIDKKPIGWVIVKLHIEILEGQQIEQNHIDIIKAAVVGRHPDIILCSFCALKKDSWSFTSLFKTWGNNVSETNPKN